MAKANMTMTADIQVAAREIDFVTRFGKNWEHLREIMGIMRPIRKQPGVTLKSKKANLVLQNGNVGEGEDIPFSKATIEEIPYEILHHITDRITHEVDGINRVVLDLTPKPIGTIEWE